MSAESEDIEIPCTIWVKKVDGKYLGCFAKADGELTRTGAKLLSDYSTLDEVKKLVEGRVIWSVLRNCGAEEPGEFYPECGESLMKMQAHEHGEYCYVFDEKTGRWMFGANASQVLSSLLSFIQR